MAVMMTMRASNLSVWSFILTVSTPMFQCLVWWSQWVRPSCTWWPECTVTRQRSARVSVCSSSSSSSWRVSSCCFWTSCSRRATVSVPESRFLSPQTSVRRSCGRRSALQQSTPAEVRFLLYWRNVQIIEVRVACSSISMRPRRDSTDSCNRASFLRWISLKFKIVHTKR